MSTLTPDEELLDRLADSFAERYRRGERPSLKEYTDRHPHLAERIRKLFPTLVVMEELGPDRRDTTGPFPPAPQTSCPQLLGEYRILREVGRGGMGVVYEAVQLSLGRHVAVKVLPFPTTLAPTLLERFRQEARVAARLHHTNIVPVHAVGEHGHLHYYVMQFIEGRGLDAILKEIKQMRGQAPPVRPAPTDELTGGLAQGLTSGRSQAPPPGGALLTPEAAPDAEKSAPTLTDGSYPGLTDGGEPNYYRNVAQLGVQVADALAYAHKQGVLHRDIKPSNLLLDTCGTVWVADFGLAKSEGAGELTTPGDIVGTVRYMAPERFRGQADARSDVYGLGITLYEMLTLRPAFGDGDRARLVEQVLHEEPPRPRQVNPHLPRDLETVILKAIAKGPPDRYPTPEALAEDLRRFLADRPVRARPTSPAERTWRWCRRNPAVASLLVLAAVLLSLIAGGASVAAVWLGRERDAAVAHEGEASRAKKDALAKLRGSYLAQARAGRWSGQPGRRFAGLAALAKAAQIEPSLELRNEAIACLALPDIELAKTLPCGPATAGAIDPLFERYAVSDRQGNLSVRRVADNREVARLPGHGTHAWMLRFSPDGSFLAAVYHTSGLLKVWDLGRQSAVLTLPASGFDFSPESSCLASHLRNSIELYELPSGRLRQRVHRRGAPGSLAFHPSGRQLAFTGDQPGQITVYDLQAGKPLRTLPSPPELRALAWHPAGGLLAAACAGNGIHLWDARTGRRQAVCTEPAGDFRTLTFNHAGDLLASTGWDETLRLWDPWTGRLLLGGPNTRAGLTLQFSRDDRLLLGSRGPSALEVWRVARGRECRALHEPPPGREEQDAAFSPDGRLLATTSDRGVRLRDSTGKEVGFLPQPGTRGVLFHPRGETLFVYGRAGLSSWPLARARGCLRVGPPQRALAPGPISHASLAADGRTVLLVRSKGDAVLVSLEGKGEKVTLRGNFQIARGALSPDGRWAVTTNRFEGGETIRVWDARTGKVVRRLPGKGVAWTEFSPDGRWLVTATGDEHRFWRARSWKAGRRLPREHAGSLPGPLAFSADARLVAVARAPRQVCLLVTETGLEVGTLTSPDPLPVGRLSFSPDGSRLVAALGNQTIQVWDLRLIRTRLAQMGLDWELPPYPPAGVLKKAP